MCLALPDVSNHKEIHTGTESHNIRYKFELPETFYLGVLVDSSTKVCAAAVKTTNYINRKRTENKTANSIMYRSVVQPNLEFCVYFWSPYNTKDITELEKLKRGETKIMREFEELPYE